MRAVFILLALLSAYALPAISQSDSIALDGNYQGRNLYIQNPFTDGTSGFCVTKVFVNGSPTKDEIQSSAFEIDFKSLDIKMGDPVQIKIRYKTNCKPKVLNPEVLKPKATFEIVEIKLSADGNLEWITKNESGKLNFIVEQFRWNKWVKLGEVEGVGTQTNNNYSYKVAIHSGKNQVRVKQIDYTNQAKLSRSAELTANICNIEFGPVKTSTDINFTCSDTKVPAETMFEVYDQYGNVVKKGNANKINVSDLKKGLYYLNYDNKMGEFNKK
ncbi:MAG: hypothetical protein ACK5D5_10000 [Bacteroidota bacterium]